MSQNDETRIMQIKAELLGRAVRAGELGIGSIVLLDLAGPEKESAYVRVECAWNLRSGTSLLVASEDDRTALRSHIAALTGQVVSGLDVLRPSHELLIDFENGHRLHAFPVYANNTKYENWIIGAPSRSVLTAGPGRELRVSRADEP